MLFSVLPALAYCRYTIVAFFLQAPIPLFYNCRPTLDIFRPLSIYKSIDLSR